METEKRRLVKNRDNDPLFSHSEFEKFCVDEVNGAGAEEVPKYVPTRHELIQLVKYWYGRVLDNDFFRFHYGGSDSGELRIGRFAPRRIRRAAAAIGQEVVDRAMKEVRDQFKVKVKNDRLWDVFENGTAEQWEAVQAETYREWREQDAADALERLEQLDKESPGAFIALVLRDWPGDNARPVLISPTDSGFNAVLQASGKFEVETDKSRIRTLMVEQQKTKMGFLRAKRQEGDWRFEFPDSKPGTVGWHFLEGVTCQIGKLLHAGKASQPA